MAAISAVDARNFFEVSILLKDATPSVTWYGSPAMQNGPEQRSLNDCIKIIDKVTQAARTTNWSAQNEIQYKIAKCATKIQELSTEAGHLIETKQVNILTRICYYIQAWFFGTPEVNVKESLQVATHVNGNVDSIRQHLSKRHAAHNKQMGYSDLKDALQNEKSHPLSAYVVRFIRTFEKLVPEDKRSRERLFACAQMELLYLEGQRGSDLWESYLRGLLDGEGHLLPSTPAMLSFLLRKVERWSETSPTANKRWIEPLQKKLGRKNT